MARALYLTNPLIELADGSQPADSLEPDTTMLGYEGLRAITLDAPFDPPPVPQPPSIRQPPAVQRAGIHW